MTTLEDVFMRKGILLIWSLLFLSGFTLTAQEGKSPFVSRVGLVSSFKAHSIIILSNSDKKEDSFNSYFLSLDTYGLYSHINDKAGVKAGVIHNSIIEKGFIDKSVAYIIYAGAGGVAGYVRDYSTIERNLGFIFGLNTSVGALASFKGSKLELGVEFDAEWAFQIRKMEESDGRLGLSWYANGILRALFPNISLFYRF